MVKKKIEDGCWGTRRGSEWNVRMIAVGSANNEQTVSSGTTQLLTFLLFNVDTESNLVMNIQI